MLKWTSTHTASHNKKYNYTIGFSRILLKNSYEGNQIKNVILPAFRKLDNPVS